MSDAPAAPDVEDRHRATVALWGFLARPYNDEEAAQCLMGVPPMITRQLAGVVMASCPEADRLLDNMPTALRALAVVTHDQAVRCLGEIRGPMLWAETVAARAATAGRTDVFVCSSAIRAYDSPENRVMMSALERIYQASRAGESLAAMVGGTDLANKVRENGTRARQYMEHRALSGVARGQLDNRSLARTRNGTRRRTYQGAIDIVDKGRHPLTVHDLLSFVDPRTSRQHQVLLAMAERLAARDVPLIEPMPTPYGHLELGPLIYRHPTVAATDRASGIVAPGLVIDVPDPIDHPDLAKAATDLARWNPTVRTILVVDDADIDRAVDEVASALAPA